MLRDLGEFLADSGYHPQRLSEELELSEGLYANNENLEPLLWKTAGDTLLPVLARLFFVGWPVDEALCTRLIPSNLLAAASDRGLLTRSGGAIESQVSIIPFHRFLIACDNARLHCNNPDMVMGPAGTSTQFLARLAIPGENEITLDIGSGNGVLALHAAAYSRRVTGTDINARSIPLARINAELNGIASAEFLAGDAFEPVSSRRFTRILANPPFFLTPAKKFTYCDSPLQLDGFTQRLATQSPGYLEEGGYFQMICQWADLESHPWEQRLRDWTAASGCDVLVLLAPSCTPMAYAEIRAKEARLSQSKPPEFNFADRVNYLRDNGVKSIMSGVINMRKRTGAGPNWFVALRNDPAGPRVGPGIAERFDSLTFQATHTDEQILDTVFHFAPDVQLETTTDPATGAPTLIELVKSETPVDRLRLDQAVAACLPLFNGTQTPRAIAAKLSVPEARLLHLTRRLLQTSFLSIG